MHRACTVYEKSRPRIFLYSFSFFLYLCLRFKNRVFKHSFLGVSVKTEKSILETCSLKHCSTNNCVKPYKKRALSLSENKDEVFLATAKLL